MKKTRAHYNKKYRYWYYKGFCIHRPEGCKAYNIREIKDRMVDWCFSVAHASSFKEAKATVDAIIDEQLEK